MKDEYDQNSTFLKKEIREDSENGKISYILRRVGLTQNSPFLNSNGGVEEWGRLKGHGGELRGEKGKEYGGKLKREKKNDINQKAYLQ